MMKNEEGVDSWEVYFKLGLISPGVLKYILFHNIC